MQIPADVETWDAERIVGWLLEQFPGKVALACSFQKEETVLLDMLFAVEPKARVFAIDTHYLFPETYAHWREVEQRYGVTIEKYEGPPVEDNLWEAPTKSSQAWFIKHFGPDVNLGNIPPEEVIPLETLRLGLRGDTLKEVLLRDNDPAAV